MFKFNTYDLYSYRQVTVSLLIGMMHPSLLGLVIVCSLLEYMKTVVVIGIILKIYNNFISKLELVGRCTF